MKKAEMKRMLNGAEMEVFVHEGNYGIANAGLLIRRLRPGEASETIARLDAQANDLRESTLLKPEPNCFRSFPGYTGFYAVHSDCKVSLGYSMGVLDDPKRAQVLFELIREKIDEANLRYVAPNCDMTQVIRALELLGCTLGNVTVNNKPYRDWLASIQKEQAS